MISECIFVPSNKTKMKDLETVQEIRRTVILTKERMVKMTTEEEITKATKFINTLRRLEEYYN